MKLIPANVQRPLLLVLACGLGGCGTTFYQASSPDVTYSQGSEAARTLQVPPDLTDVSDGEQFVVPGTDGGAITRDTLLPGVENVQFVREGESAWLAFDSPPEELWPQLLAFARKERYRIAATEPTAGTLFTQWRSEDDLRESSLLSGLIGNAEFSRLGFRLERASAGGTRLFVRQQVGDETDAERDSAAWPAETGDVDVTGALLARLLTFLGVEAQRARGIVNDEQAALVIDDAGVTSSDAGSLLVVNRGYEPAFRAVQAALAELEHDISSSDDGVGRIEFIEAGEPVIATMQAVHVGAVRVALRDANGRRLSSVREKRTLVALRDALVS